MTCMDHDVVDHATPFQTVPAPVFVAAVTPAIALQVPIVAAVDPPIFGDTGGGNDLDRHHQVSNDSG